METFIGVVSFLIVIIGGITLCHLGIDAYFTHEKYCKTVCEKKGGVFIRDSGVCTCRNGNVFLWSEGYNYKLSEP